MSGLGFAPLEEHEIRLVRLHAGVYSSPIEVSIEHAFFVPPLDMKDSDRLHSTVPPLIPQYECLSYIWGPSIKTSTVNVRINDRLVKYAIRPTLEDALKELRRPDTDRSLYVDVLSIDQSNPDEMSQQIKKFADIFHHASKVCIWLGPAADDSGLALGFIRQILDFAHLEDLPRDTNYRKHWLALSRLVSRVWFRRRWVVQEMALARRATIYCGPDEVDWFEFVDAVALFDTRWHDVVQLLAPDASLELGDVQAPGVTSLVNISTNVFRKDRHGNILERRYDLETLLAILPMFEISQPVDAVYSVLALARDTNAMENITMDQNRRPGQVFAEAIRHISETTGSLDIICRPWAPDLNSRQLKAPGLDPWGLPSWITTTSAFSFVQRPNGQYDRENADSLVGLPGRRRYNAALHTSSRGAVHFSLNTDILMMRVKGWQIDVIKRDGGPSYNGDIPEKWQRLGGWLNRAGTPVTSDFWRTLVADRTAEGDNPPNWYGKACEYSFRLVNTRHVSTTKLMAFCKGSSHLKEYLRRVQAATWNRNMFVTEDLECLGVGPSSLEEGDSICILYGCSVPVILRGHPTHFEFIGECFVYGMMEGQYVQWVGAGTRQLTEFMLY